MSLDVGMTLSGHGAMCLLHVITNISHNCCLNTGLVDTYCTNGLGDWSSAVIAYYISAWLIDHYQGTYSVLQVVLRVCALSVVRDGQIKDLELASHLGVLLKDTHRFQLPPEWQSKSFLFLQNQDLGRESFVVQWNTWFENLLFLSSTF